MIRFQIIPKERDISSITDSARSGGIWIGPCWDWVGRQDCTYPGWLCWVLRKSSQTWLRNFINYKKSALHIYLQGLMTKPDSPLGAGEVPTILGSSYLPTPSPHCPSNTHTYYLSSGCHNEIPSTEIYFLTVLEAGRSGCQHGQALVRPLFLACRQLPSHCVHVERERDLFFILFSYGHQSNWIRTPPLWFHLTLVSS